MSEDRAVMISDAGLQALNRHSLTRADGRVLWHLVSTLPLTGAPVSHVTLGKALAITNVNLTSTMRLLCEQGFLVRGPKIGKSYHYKLNPVYFRII